MTRTAPRLLLLTLCLAGPALAQPAGGGIAPAIDSSVGSLAGPPTDPAAGLILFSMANRPASYPIATVADQMTRQTALLRSLLQANTGERSTLFRDLHDSIFSVSRAVLNNQLTEPSTALARGLMPYVTEDMARLLRKRHGNYAEAGLGDLGPRPILYDTARAIARLLRGPGDQRVGDRAAMVAFLRGLVGAVPYEGGLGCKDRQFITQLLVHGLFRALYPQLPTSGGHRFDGSVDLIEVDGDVGEAIDGLARAWTLGGRRKNIARLVAAIDRLEAGTP